MRLPYQRDDNLQPETVTRRELSSSSCREARGWNLVIWKMEKKGVGNLKPALCQARRAGLSAK